MPSKFEHISGLSAAVGIANAISILGRRLLKLKKPIKVTIDGDVLQVRPSDSDLFVLAQIFGSKDYDIGECRRLRLNQRAELFRKNGETPVIVDAGANVGYSSVYFARTYPNAEILALEPDKDAYAILCENCLSLPNIRPINAALWSHNEGVQIENPQRSSWARTVSDGGLTQSFTLDRLLHSTPNFRPLILKVDIEGAEREALKGYPDLIRSFSGILIEPHDFMIPGGGCLTPLIAAIAGKEIDTIIKGENLFFFDRDLAIQPT